MGFSTSESDKGATKQDIYNAIIGQGFGDRVAGEIEYYSDLPSASASLGLVFHVLKRTPNYWTLGATSRHLAGFYEANGTSWNYIASEPLPVYSPSKGDTPETENYRLMTPKDIGEIASVAQVEASNENKIVSKNGSVDGCNNVVCAQSGTTELTVSAGDEFLLSCAEDSRVTISSGQSYTPSTGTQMYVDVPSSSQILNGEGAYGTKVVMTSCYLSSAANYTFMAGFHETTGGLNASNSVLMRVNSGVLEVSLRTSSNLILTPIVFDIPLPLGSFFNLELEIVSGNLVSRLASLGVTYTRTVTAHDTLGWHPSSWGGGLGSVFTFSDAILYNVTGSSQIITAASGTVTTATSETLPYGYRGIIAVDSSENVTASSMRKAERYPISRSRTISSSVDDGFVIDEELSLRTVPVTSGSTSSVNLFGLYRGGGTRKVYFQSDWATTSSSGLKKRSHMATSDSVMPTAFFNGFEDNEMTSLTVKYFNGTTFKLERCYVFELIRMGGKFYAEGYVEY